MGSSRTRARTRVPCIGRRILNHCATREVLLIRFLSNSAAHPGMVYSCHIEQFTVAAPCLPAFFLQCSLCLEGPPSVCQLRKLLLVLLAQLLHEALRHTSPGKTHHPLCSVSPRLCTHLHYSSCIVFRGVNYLPDSSRRLWLSIFTLSHLLPGSSIGPSTECVQ